MGRMCVQEEVYSQPREAEPQAPREHARWGGRRSREGQRGSWGRGRRAGHRLSLAWGCPVLPPGLGLRGWGWGVTGVRGEMRGPGGPQQAGPRGPLPSASVLGAHTQTKWGLHDAPMNRSSQTQACLSSPRDPQHGPLSLSWAFVSSQVHCL